MTYKKNAQGARRALAAAVDAEDAGLDERALEHIFDAWRHLVSWRMDIEQRRRSEDEADARLPGDAS